MGQGLQGLLPIDHLAGLIIFDISVKGGGMASYQVKGLLETWPVGFFWEKGGDFLMHFAI